MKDTLFKLFQRIGHIVSGKGLARLPFASQAYRFLYGLLKPTGIVSVSSDGHVLLINAKDTGLGPPLIMHGVFAPVETKILRGLLEPGMVFVDIGANIGYFSLIAAREVTRSGRVYAFEPDNEHYSLLVKNSERNGYTNIDAIRIALSDSAGTSQFYRKPDNLCAHSLVPDPQSEVVEVDTTTLDLFMKPGERIDVIKIDVEGAEPKVLAGMKRTIVERERLAMVTEFYPKALEECGVSPERYLRDLHEMGFELYRIGEREGEDLLTLIDEKMLVQLGGGEGIDKLINILCLKHWPLDRTVFTK